MPKEESAGAVLFYEKGGTIEYLLLRYDETGHWDFPKGHIESGETEKKALQREVFEETGIKNLVLAPEFKKTIKYFFRQNNKTVFKTVVFYLAYTKTQKVKISFEHMGYKWLSYADALQQLTFANAKAVLKKADRYLKTRVS